MGLFLKYLVFALLITLTGCNQKESGKVSGKKIDECTKIHLGYAKGFTIEDCGNYKVMKVINPLSNASKTYTYLLLKRGEESPDSLEYDAKVNIPVRRVVATSTTQIPFIVDLHQKKTLKGFPHLDFISSPVIRARIKKGKLKDVGENNEINTEILLELNPDLVIGFGISDPKIYTNITKGGIPVFWDGDWTETSPLGKAEWIKFFGALYDKDSLASAIFNRVKESYLSAKNRAKNVGKKPEVLSGAMFKDVWYAPRGGSWAAELIRDAGGVYVFGNTKGEGSLSLSFETVYEEARDAEFWISPSGFQSYKAMLSSSVHYSRFKAFKEREIYTYAFSKGETGGMTYFELGPSRPDLILKDLIHVFHPEVLPKYKSTFYKPLK